MPEMRGTGFADSMGQAMFDHSIRHLTWFKDADRSQWDKADRIEWNIQLKNFFYGFQRYKDRLPNPLLGYVKELATDLHPEFKRLEELTKTDILEVIDAEIERRRQEYARGVSERGHIT